MRLTKFQAKKYKKYYVVYRIKNIENGLLYFGCHKIKFGNEKDGYICSSKSLLPLIIKNHSKFKRTVVARFSTAREADRYETKMIKKYDTFRNGYNRSSNGGVYCAHGIKLKGKGIHYKTRTEEQRKKYSQITKQKWKDGCFDHYLYSADCAEQRHNRSVNMIQTRKSRYGDKCMPQESYDKMRNKVIKRFSNPEERKKTSEATKLAMARPEVKKKNIENTKKAMYRPEVRFNQLSGLKKAGKNLSSKTAKELAMLEKILSKEEIK